MISQLDNNNKLKIIILFCISLFVITGCSLPSFGKKIANFGCNDFIPVCGNDSVTYYNECQAKEYKAEVVYDGACNDGITVIPYGKIE